MAHTSLTSLFSDIADAIRAKTGSSASIVADDFPTAIGNIPSLRIGTATAYPTNGTTCSFTVLGEPLLFSCAPCSGTFSSTSSTKYPLSMVYDGTSIECASGHGSNSKFNCSYAGSSSTFAYSDGTLTITMSGAKFWTTTNTLYRLVYVY